VERRLTHSNSRRRRKQQQTRNSWELPKPLNFTRNRAMLPL